MAQFTMKDLWCIVKKIKSQGGVCGPTLRRCCLNFGSSTYRKICWLRSSHLATNHEYVWKDLGQQSSCKKMQNHCERKGSFWFYIDSLFTSCLGQIMLKVVWVGKLSLDHDPSSDPCVISWTKIWQSSEILQWCLWGWLNVRMLRDVWCLWVGKYFLMPMHSG